MEGDEGRSGTRHFCEGSCFRGWKAAMLVYCNAGCLLFAPSCSPWCQEAALALLALNARRCLWFPAGRGAALPCQHVPAVLPKASSLADIPELRLFCGCYSADCRSLLC